MNESHHTHACSACSASFPNKYQLEQHATNTKHKAYVCTCGKGFTRLCALRRHNTEARQARKHQCPLCDHKCKRTGHVEQHLRLIHRMSKHAIKKLLGAQKPVLHQELEQASTGSSSAPTPGSMDGHAEYSTMIPARTRTELAVLAPAIPANHDVSLAGNFSAFPLDFPAAGTEDLSWGRADVQRNFMSQATEVPADPAYSAGAVATPAGIPAESAPKFASYPAAHPNGNCRHFNRDQASDTMNGADFFEMPELEIEFNGEFYDFDLDNFGF